jgi:hypothetical protein
MNTSKRPYIANGLDQQGRRSEDEIEDDGRSAARGLVYGLLCFLAVSAVLIIVWWVML